MPGKVLSDGKDQLSDQAQNLCIDPTLSLFFSSLSFTILYCSSPSPLYWSHPLPHTHKHTHKCHKHAASLTYTHSLSSASVWLNTFSFLGTQQQSLTVSLSHTQHTHTLSHTLTHTPSGRNPAVCSCSALDMPDRLLWGGRFVCKNLFLIHSLIWLLMWANVGPAWKFFTPCDGLFWSFVPSDLLMLYFGYI